MRTILFLQSISPPSKTILCHIIGGQPLSKKKHPLHNSLKHTLTRLVYVLNPQRARLRTHCHPPNDRHVAPLYPGSIYEPSLSICLSSFVLWKLISSSSCSSIVGALVRPADDELLARLAMADDGLRAPSAFHLGSPRSSRVCQSSASSTCVRLRSRTRMSLAPSNQERRTRRAAVPLEGPVRAWRTAPAMTTKDGER